MSAQRCITASAATAAVLDLASRLLREPERVAAAAGEVAVGCARQYCVQASVGKRSGKTSGNLRSQAGRETCKGCAHSTGDGGSSPPTRSETQDLAGRWPLTGCGHLRSLVGFDKLLGDINKFGLH